MTAADKDPVLPFKTQDDWAGWLAANHGTSNGLWLKLAKADSGLPTVTYAEAVESALCWGWIDGQKKKLDDAHWLQRFVPRRPRSVWSKINRGKAEALIAAGRMQPPGLREVERAKADGRWDAAYDSQRTATVPADLQAALDAEPAAAEVFAGLNSSNRYAILYRVNEAKKPETRARRIEKFVAMLRAGDRLY